MKMSCSIIRSSLSAYIDGELAPRKKGIVEHHLSYCSACRDYLADLYRLDYCLRDLPECSPPENLASGILTHVRETDLLPIVGNRFLIRLAWTAAAVIVLMLGFTTGYMMQTVREDPGSKNPVVITDMQPSAWENTLDLFPPGSPVIDYAELLDKKETRP